MDRIEKYARILCVEDGVDPGVYDHHSLDTTYGWQSYIDAAKAVMELADDERADAYAEGHDDGFKLAREGYGWSI